MLDLNIVMFICFHVLHAPKVLQRKCPSLSVTSTLIAKVNLVAESGSILRDHSIGLDRLQATRIGTRTWSIRAPPTARPAACTHHPASGQPFSVPRVSPMAITYPYGMRIMTIILHFRTSFPSEAGLSLTPSSTKAIRLFAVSTWISITHPLGQVKIRRTASIQSRASGLKLYNL